MRKLIALVLILLLPYATAESVLVAYFSATGTTRQVAEMIAEQLDADLYEIVPADPYSEEDLNYSVSDCRANREQDDSSIRPEIIDDDMNVEGYDVILIGHPIWWGEEPRIIDTFMDTYDLSGKRLANFCTSGSSGIGKAAENLMKKAPEAQWLGECRFSSNAGENEISEWLGQIGLIGSK